MDLALIPKAAPQAIHTTLGDTAVILNLDDSNYYMLNATGSAVWRLCDGAHGLNTIIASLTEQFDVTPQQAEASLERLMEDLVKARLLTPSMISASKH